MVELLVYLTESNTLKSITTYLSKTQNPSSRRGFLLPYIYF